MTGIIQRTNQQNRYYHACFVRPLADALTRRGEPTAHAEAHELLKLRFCPKRAVVDAYGEILREETGSTAELDVREFSEYLERCRVWMFEEFGIIVPEANEVTAEWREGDVF